MTDSDNRNNLTEDPEEETSAAPQKSAGSEILSYVIMLASVVLIMLLLNNFVVINARIPSSSMENTIMVNDQILGNRLAYLSSDPKRFDIIIFKYPDDESKLFIKRVIGLPGDIVNIVDGKVYIDGSTDPLDDSFCRETPQGSFGPYTVPDNCYFVMGDNRNDSHDSRYWTNTYVRKDQILGRAFFRYWPLNKIGPI
jgi:signal peptidase I